MGSHGQHRPRVDEHADRRGAGHHQPATRAAAAIGHLRHPCQCAGVAGPRTASRQRANRQRRVQAAVAVLRPGVAPRTVAVRPAGCDACAHRPRRDRRRDDRAAPGCPGRGVRLAGIAVRRTDLAHRPAGAGTIGDRQGRRRDPLRAAPVDRGGRRRDLLRRQRRVGGVRREDRHPGFGDAGRQGVAAATTTRSRSARSVRPERPPPTRWPPRPMW